MIKSALGAIGALLLGIAPLSATEPDAAIPTVEVLPLSFAQSGVSGPGGERIKAELVDAQFVALGEDHGFATEMGKRRSDAAAQLADSRTEAFLAEHLA